MHATASLELLPGRGRGGRGVVRSRGTFPGGHAAILHPCFVPAGAANFAGQTRRTRGGAGPRMFRRSRCLENERRAALDDACTVGDRRAFSAWSPGLHCFAWSLSCWCAHVARVSISEAGTCRGRGCPRVAAGLHGTVETRSSRRLSKAMHLDAAILKKYSRLVGGPFGQVSRYRREECGWLVESLRRGWAPVGAKGRRA